MATRETKVVLRADVAGYISAMRAAEAASRQFADRAIADAARVAQAQRTSAAPTPGAGGTPSTPGAPRVNASGRTAAQEAEARRLVTEERRRQAEVANAARAAAAEQERLARDAQRRAQEVARAEEEAARRRKAAMQDVGTAAAASGALVAAGFLMSAKAAIQWESAWAGVTKTVNGTNAEMADLEDQLRGMAKTLPVSSTEIAKVAENAGQLGIQRENIAGFTKVMIDLGVSTNLSADEASTSIAQMMNVMRTAPAHVDRLGATLVALGNAGASTEAEIMHMAQRLSGAGALINASESDVLAMANAMASVGIEAELGGGSMSRTMTKIYSAVQQGGAALTGFSKVAGMTANEFATAFESDPIRAVDAFVGGLGRIKDSGGNVVAALADVKIKGTQDLQVLLRLAGAGDLLTQSLDLGAKAWQDNTALLNEANKRYDTVASKLQIAKNNLNDLAIQIGDVLLPIIAKFADGASGIIDFFERLPGPAREVAVVLGAIAGGVGLLGGALLLTLPRIAATRAALATLGATAMWTSIRINFRLATNLIGGPWVAALGIAALAVGALFLAHRKGKPDISDLTQAIQADTGALGDNTKATMANRLEKSGILLTAERLKVGLADVTQAAMGNADALDRVNAATAAAEAPARAQIAALRETMAHTTDLGTQRRQQFDLQHLLTTGAIADTQELSKAIGSQAGMSADAVDAAKRVADATANQGLSAAEAAAKAERLNQAMGGVPGTAGPATDGAKKLGGTLKETAAQAGLTTEQLDKLVSAVDALVSSEFEGDRATIDYKDKLAALATQVKEGTTSLDLNRKSGRENASAVMDLVQATGKQIDAVIRNGGAQSDVEAKTKAAKKSLEDQLTTLGFSKDAVKRYTDALDDIPARTTTELTVTDATALKEAGFFGQTLAAMKRAIERDPVKFAVDSAAARADTKSFLAFMRQGLADIPDESVKVGIGVFTSVDTAKKQTGFSIALNKAAGGPISGPGGPRDDAIPAWLSDGEYVINASATSRHRDLLDAINADGYADGGPVTIRGDAAFDKPSARAALNQARGEVDSYAEALGRAGSAAVAAYQRAHPDVPAGGSSSPSLAGGLSFARSQQGKPYVWGAVGPGGYDCSGFQSAIENVIQGRPVHQRRFATASFGYGKGAAGFVPGGGGAYSLGVIQAMGGIPGHMAGTINGVNVESRGGAGVVIGSGARGANHSLFRNHYHLAGYAGGGPIGRSLTPIRGGGSRGAIPVRLTLDITGTDQEMKTMMRRIVRENGRGDVQLTFGTS
jgi:TP901 family phage tail tape measure protein